MPEHWNDVETEKSVKKLECRVAIDIDMKKFRVHLYTAW